MDGRGANIVVRQGSVESSCRRSIRVDPDASLDRWQRAIGSLRCAQTQLAQASTESPTSHLQGVSMSTFDRQGRALGARLPEPADPVAASAPSRMRAWLARVLLLGCAAMHAGAWAQGTISIYDEQDKLVRSDGQVTPLKGDLLGDQISLYSGALEFVNADVAIPGNNALPIGVARRHVTGQLRVAAEASVTTGIFG